MKSLSVLTNLNPSMPFGGLGRLSKYSIIDRLRNKNNSEFFPNSILLKISQSNKERLRNTVLFIKENKFPIVAKPDVGFTGLGVKIFTKNESLLGFINKQKVDYVLESFCSSDHELGVFYLKIPGQKKGKVIGIGEKIFPHIIGDGKNTLIWLTAKLNLDKFTKEYLKKKYQNINYVPKKDEIIHLIGLSHIAGEQTYVDKTHELNQGFSKIIEKISSQIPDLYYGRYDIKISKWPLTDEKFDMKILELNPSIDTIPLHFYDKKYSFFQRYKHILGLLDTAVKISSKNKSNCKINVKISLFGLMKEQIRLVKHLRNI